MGIGGRGIALEVSHMGDTKRWVVWRVVRVVLRAVDEGVDGSVGGWAVESDSPVRESNIPSLN